jgi:hypothetical protein
MIHVGADQLAELLVTGLVGWVGERGDIVVDVRIPGRDGPAETARHLVLPGDGNHERSFGLAAELRGRIKEAVLDAILGFSERKPA